MFLFTAGALLIPMKEDLIKMVPRIFPYPRLLMYVTGGFEVLGAIGLLIPATRGVAGFCLAALFIAMFPANINATIKHISLRGKSPTPLQLRMPKQLVYIGLALWSAMP
jgi:uncharacterized membrane protein